MIHKTRPLAEIDYPKNKEEWWLLVDANWDALKSIVYSFHPTISMWRSIPDTSKGLPLGTVNVVGARITAPNAERACEEVRKKIKQEGKFYNIERLKANRDDELHRVFNQTWFGIPESTGAWSIPKFGLLCDLCSEGYVLEEEDV